MNAKTIVEILKKYECELSDGYEYYTVNVDQTLTKIADEILNP